LYIDGRVCLGCWSPWEVRAPALTKILGCWSPSSDKKDCGSDPQPGSARKGCVNPRADLNIHQNGENKNPYNLRSPFICLHNEVLFNSDLPTRPVWARTRS